jgi:hypothetical protein
MIDSKTIETALFGTRRVHMCAVRVVSKRWSSAHFRLDLYGG